MKFIRRLCDFSPNVKLLEFPVFEGHKSNIIDPNRITVLKASRAGIFISKVTLWNAC